MIVIKITATVTIMILIMTRMKTITTLKITKMTEVSFQAVFGMSRMSRNPERKFTVKLILLQILKYLFMSVGFQRGCYSEGYKKSGSH